MHRPPTSHARSSTAQVVGFSSESRAHEPNRPPCVGALHQPPTRLPARTLRQRDAALHGGLQAAVLHEDPDITLDDGPVDPVDLAADFVVEFGGVGISRPVGEHRILERHDLITKKRRRSGKPGHPGKPLTPMDEPNAVWTVDFKGQFKMLNGRYCYPLTIQDGFSRFLLECRGLYSTSIELAKPVFIKVFREFGLPAVIRSDNGTPFASIGLARLTRLSAWWIRLGIRPETIEPGKPQQNGRHERMHRTLKREATRPPKANLRAQQRHFNQFRSTPTSSLRSSIPSTSRSERSLRTEGSAGTPVGSTSARLSATSSSGSNPSVWLCGKSTSDPLPSGGLTKNSSSFATPTVTQDVTQSVNHQLAPLCQPSGALFSVSENIPCE